MSQKTTIVLFSLATASLDGDVGVVANNTAKADRKKGGVPFNSIWVVRYRNRS